MISSNDPALAPEQLSPALAYLLDAARTRFCGLCSVRTAKCLIQIEAAVLNRLRAMRTPSESYGNVILRLFELSRRDASA